MLRWLSRYVSSALMVTSTAVASCSPDAVSTAPSCTDGVRNGSEADVDCGGSCGPCATGAKCGATSDCLSDFCATGVCTEPSCNDGQKNGAESDVDCGGDTCPICSDGRVCVAGADCNSGVCSAGVCAPASCTDGILNGTEIDVDCGNGSCPACGDGRTCNGPPGCLNHVCVGGKCSAPSCTDGVKNGSEPLVDCGGGCLCSQGQPCSGNNDCKDGVCATTCLAPTCKDGVKNGSETSLDCGGPACSPCDVGMGCAVGPDCTSGVCTAHTCAAPSCSDSVANGDETDVDCGGPTCPTACMNNAHCIGNSDCLSLHCQNLSCVAASCTDNVMNGNETAIDCGGGPPCNACAVGIACLIGTDCIEGVCDTTHHCAAPTCNDGVKNQNETDVDCGGTSNLGVDCIFRNCGNGRGCATASDCASGDCVGMHCASHGERIGGGGIDEVTSVFQTSNLPITSTFYSTLITGSFHGTVDFGTGPIDSSGGSDVFVGLYNTDGTAVWVRTFGGPGDDRGRGVAQLGHLYVVGSFSGSVSFDSVNLVSGGGSDAFAASLAYDTGAVQWARGFGGSGTEVASGVAPLGTQDAIVTGFFDSTNVDFGGGLVPSNGGSSFVLRLSQVDGSLVWSNAFGGASAIHPPLVSADGNEEVVVAGAAQGVQSFGCGTTSAPGGLDIFVTRRDSIDGHCLWAVVHGGAGDDYPTAMTEASDLRRVVAGVFAPPASLGGLSFATGSMFVASYAHTGGAHIDSKAFGAATGINEIRGIGGDPSNDFYITGRFSAPTLAFGGTTLTNQGSYDVFVAKLTTNLVPITAKSFGGPGDDEGLAIANAYYNAAVLVAGTFDQSIDLGGGNLLTAGATDIFIASLGTFP